MITLAAVCVVLVAGAPLVGPMPDDGTDSVALDDVLRMAAGSPYVEAIEADIAVAETDEHQARLYPNPELVYQGYGRLVGTANAINGQQHQVDLGIPLLLAGQRRARVKAARLRTEVVRAATCLSRKAIQREAADRFVDLLAAQERLARLSEGRAVLADAETLTRKRAARGAQTEYDAERVGYELRLLDNEIRVAEADLREASRRLATALGRPRWTPRAEGTLAGLRTSVESADELDDVPAVVVARRDEEAAEAGVVLEKKERWPVPMLSGGTYVTTDGGSASVTFGVALPLPIFDRGQARVARARAEVRRARSTKRAVEYATEGEIARARAALSARRGALEAFNRDTRSVAPRLRAMAHKAYEGGVSSVLELIDAERTYLDARLREVDLASDFAGAVVDIEAARGTIGGSCE